MRECAAIAAALGAAPTIDIEARLALTERLGDHKTSMLQDLEAGRTLELDALLGAVVELATVTATQAPTLRTLLALTDLLR
jgi:2-dehydropantoate 2-reductase